MSGLQFADIDGWRAALAQDRAAALAEAVRMAAASQTELNALITPALIPPIADHVGSGTGDLAGIPYAHKDLFCSEGVRATAGSRIFQNSTTMFSAVGMMPLMNFTSRLKFL